MYIDNSVLLYIICCKQDESLALIADPSPAAVIDTGRQLIIAVFETSRGSLDEMLPYSDVFIITFKYLKKK